jgi:hypothetical protein
VAWPEVISVSASMNTFPNVTETPKSQEYTVWLRTNAGLPNRSHCVDVYACNHDEAIDAAIAMLRVTSVPDISRAFWTANKVERLGTLPKRHPTRIVPLAATHSVGAL